jgi:ABC-type enterochelin transport system substrate-binding protein
MNVRMKDTLVTVKLLKAEANYLESAQGILTSLARVYGTDHAGELAATAAKAIAELSAIMAAEPKAMVSR